MSLTVERLKELLEYDQLAGVFFWKVSRRSYAGKVSPGVLAGDLHANGRWRIGIDGHRYHVHRLAWLYAYGKWPIGRLDHRDTNPGNNRIDNLREATNSQNMANTQLRVTNTSGVKGVIFDRERNRWRAQITVNRRLIVLGRFKAKADAAIAYRVAAERYFGEFARAA